MWLYLEDNSITDRSAMETLKEGHKYLGISGGGGWGGGGVGGGGGGGSGGGNNTNFLECVYLLKKQSILETFVFSLVN